MATLQKLNLFMILKTAFEKLFHLRESAGKARPGADDGFDAHEKPFLDHLEDLRHTLMKIGATLAIATVACFAFHKKIFELIQLPAKMPIANISDGVSLWDRLDLITLSPPEFIVLMLKLSFFSGVIISFPFLLYFGFQFILPGLRQVEKKAIIPGALVGFILFLVGVCFAFFMAAPVALKFFYIFENERIASIDPTRDAMEKPIADFSLLGADGKIYEPVGEDGDKPKAEEDAGAPSELTNEMREEIRKTIKNSFATMQSSNFALRYDDSRDMLVLVESKGGRSLYRIGEYIAFISRLVLVFGISFQLPVVVSILVKLELLTARVMRATRTYAWIIIMVAAAILTPPDLMTLGLLAGPMILLYEICIIIASFIERGREKKMLAEEQAKMTRLEQLYSKNPDDLSEEEKSEIHKAEIEQYEKEHAHLYDDDHGDHADHGNDETVARDSYLGQEHDEHYDFDADHAEFDESWHEDDHGDHDGHYDDHHHGEGEDSKSNQDRPNREEEGLESDHVEKEDLEPVDEDSKDGEGESAEADKSDGAPAARDDYDDGFHDDEACAPSGPVVDMNHATAEELKTLPGIGPKLAEAIIEYRPFETFDDLEAVPGLSSEKVNAMIDRLMLG